MSALRIPPLQTPEVRPVPIERRPCLLPGPLAPVVVRVSWWQRIRRIFL